jgi:hypothetical protein
MRNSSQAVSEVPDTDLALGELVDQVQGVADRPTEAVERVHDDHVTLARVRDTSRSPGRSVVAPDFLSM